MRPDLFTELLHELLHNWLAVKLAPPHLHIEKKARESGASERFRRGCRECRERRGQIARPSPPG
jgi:hypothetical protein